jgi:hypothetical protein
VSFRYTNRCYHFIGLGGIDLSEDDKQVVFKSPWDGARKVNVSFDRESLQDSASKVMAWVTGIGPYP